MNAIVSQPQQLDSHGTSIVTAFSGPPAFLIPDSYEAIERMAKKICDAKWVPKGYLMNGVPNQAMVEVSIMHGMEVGLRPLAAVQNIAIINGMPSVWGDGLLALVVSSGLLEDHVETFDGEGDKFGAYVRMKRRGRPTPFEQRFTVEMARRAGLLNKEGPWKQYTSRMMTLRARSWVIRGLFPDVIKGLYSAEEAIDGILEMGEYGAPGSSHGATGYLSTPLARPQASQFEDSNIPTAEVTDVEAEPVVEQQPEPPKPQQQTAAATRPATKAVKTPPAKAAQPEQAPAQQPKPQAARQPEPQPQQQPPAQPRQAMPDERDMRQPAQQQASAPAEPPADEVWDLVDPWGEVVGTVTTTTDAYFAVHDLLKQYPDHRATIEEANCDLINWMGGLDANFHGGDADSGSAAGAQSFYVEMEIEDGESNFAGWISAAAEMMNQCSTPDDFRAFAQQNAANLEACKGNVRSWWKSLDDRIQRGIAGRSR